MLAARSSKSISKHVAEPVRSPLRTPICGGGSAVQREAWGENTFVLALGTSTRSLETVSLAKYEVALWTARGLQYKALAQILGSDQMPQMLDHFTLRYTQRCRQIVR